jgi:hypothetical protein
MLWPLFWRFSTIFGEKNGDYLKTNGIAIFSIYVNSSYNLSQSCQKILSKIY